MSADRFGILIALGFVAFAYVGGITMVSGAVFGGLIAVRGRVLALHAGRDRGLGHVDAVLGGLTLILNLDLLP